MLGNLIKNRKKAVICAGALLIAVLTAVGVTLAYIIANSGPVENEFKPSIVTTSVVETLEGETKKNVNIANTGDTEAYIRAAVVFNWRDENGSIFGETPEENVDYDIKWSVSNECLNDVWVKGRDGFYYYTSPVAPGENTKDLITSCTAKNERSINGVTYYLSVDIVCSGIQSTPTSVVKDNWSSAVIGLNGNVLVIQRD